MEKIIFIDIETTGLNPEIHEIIEIAILGAGIKYHKKVKPLNLEYADPKALLINGFTSKEWRYAEMPLDVAIEIAPIISGATIVGHNPFFDMSFLEELFFQYDISVTYDRRLIDTITLAHAHLKPLGLKSLSLDSIRKFLDWSMKDAHTALKDAEDCRRLYYLLINSKPLHKKLLGFRRLLKDLLKKYL